MKTYELKDYLGTPRVTYNDVKTPDESKAGAYKLDVLSAVTSYPYGEAIPALSYEKTAYNYGFTGHKKNSPRSN